MRLIAPPFFFIIRIDIQKQKQTREFDGQLAVSPNYKFMQHEVQYGEIVSIGDVAQKNFPDVKIGQTLIFHHFVTGKGIEGNEDNPYLIHTDENYNYYNVTVVSYNGDRNLSYGVWDGEKIIPHKDFIFLEVEENEKQLVQTDNLVEIKNWSESRDKKTDKIKYIKNTILGITKSLANDDLKVEIEKREKQMNKISKDINKKQIQLYKVAYSHPSISFKEVGILNIACHTKITFMNKEYIVAPTKKYMHFGTT